MALERTFSIIKPDATRRNITGKIISKLEEGGLRVVASKRIRMTKEQAEGFYAVHKERPFFGELVEFMMSEPVVVQVLEGETPSRKTARSWARPTRRKPPPARSAPTSPNRSTPTPCTALTPPKPPLWKSLSSSPV